MQKLHWKNLTHAGDYCRIVQHRVSQTGVVAVHTHDFPEIFWGISGKAIHEINGDKQILSKGELVMIRPKDSHGIKSANSEYYIFINIVLSHEIVDYIKQHYFQNDKNFWNESSRLPIPTQLSAVQLQWINSASYNLLSNKNSRLEVDRFLLNLFSELQTHKDTILRRCPEWLYDACKQLKEPENFRLGAKALAVISGRSPEHVARVLKKYTRMTPSEIVNQARMEHAAALLATTTMSITEIAYECGYSSLAYFFEQFRKFYQETPKEYRSSHLKAVPRATVINH